MSEKVSIVKIGFWTTVILGVLKIAGLIDISNFLVFLPLIIGIAWLFFIIFIIGLITVYFYVEEMEKNESEEAESEEEA
jgi:hypothetical protein